MKVFSEYIRYIKILRSLLINDFDTDVINYVTLFDNIPEEPLYINKELTIYISKKNGKMSFYVDLFSKKLINKTEITNFNDIENIIKTYNI